MQISPELVALVDELHREHPRFPRATIERLILRTARTVGGEAVAPTVAAIREEAAEQLTYLDQGDCWGRVSVNS